MRALSNRENTDHLTCYNGFMDIFTDPRERVKEAHLRYVSDTKTKGITRVKKRAGFTFLDTDGKSVSKADRARIKNLVIPPGMAKRVDFPF